MDIHEEFVRLGKMRNHLTHQLQSLLPEIDRQKIWEKKGFQSIYHYASVLAGLSPGVVDKVLWVEKKLEDKPCLKEAIKTEGVHKVALVAKIATPENDEEMAKIVRNCSKRAVQQYSKEIRGKENMLSIELDNEMQQMFFRLKNKIGDKLSNKEVLRRILRKAAGAGVSTGVEPGDQEAKVDLDAKIEIPDAELAEAKNFPGEKIASRYIPAKTRKFILKKYHKKCAYPGCNGNADVLHHRERFANAKTHKSLVPLCKIHHEFAHNGLIRHELQEPSSWTLGQKVHRELEDALWQKYRGG